MAADSTITNAYFNQPGASAAYYQQYQQGPPPKPSAADKIRARLKEKSEEYEDFRRHIEMRLREEDAHGIWDGGVCLSEVSNYIDGLLFCLQAMGEKE